MRAVSRRRFSLPDGKIRVEFYEYQEQPSEDGDFAKRFKEVLVDSWEEDDPDPDDKMTLEESNRRDWKKFKERQKR